MDRFPRFPGFTARPVRQGATLRSLTLRRSGRARSPNASAVSPDEARQFISGVLADIGIEPRFITRTAFQLPFLPNRTFRIPSTSYELDETMLVIQNEYESYAQANTLPDILPEAPEGDEEGDDEPQGPHGPDGPLDFDQQPDAPSIGPALGAVFNFAVLLTSANTSDGAPFETEVLVEGTIEDYNFLQDEASNSPAQRVEYYHNLVNTSPEQRYEEGFVDINAVATSSSGAQAGAGAALPLSVIPASNSHVEPAGSAFYRSLQYANPLRRLSWNSAAPFVDHVGVTYEPELLLQRAAGRVTDRTFVPKDPYLRHNYIPDLCWFNAIIDLVNTRMNRPWMTYDKLWVRYLKKPGAFQPEVAALGMNIEDVVPVFDHLDREVIVLDGEGAIVYYRERTSRVYNHILPHRWVFVMTENHVYHVNPNMEADDRSSLKKHLRFAPRQGEYEAMLSDYPYETLSPFFPCRERTKPSLIADRKFSRRSKQPPTLLLFLVEDPVPDPDHVTMHEVLFHSRYKDCNLTVIVQADLLTNVLRPLVRDYAYRPSVYGSGPSDVHAVIMRSLGDRGIVRFVRPFPSAAAALPDLSLPQDGVISDRSQYLDFMRVEHDFYCSLVSPDLVSTMHETVHQVARTFVRGGLHGWLQAPPRPGEPAMQLSSVDMNRVYPSVFKRGWVPVCDVFDRFRSMPGFYEERELRRFYDEELEDAYLLSVLIYDTPTCYVERGAALCFKANLDEFLKRPGVVLMVDGQVPATLASASGYNTYVHLRAYLPCRKVRTGIWESVVRTWEAGDLPRWLRKKALVRSIGKLGRACNQRYREASIFLNFLEAQSCAENSNGKMANIEDEIYLAFRDGDRVPRLEGGYLMHLFVLDSYRASLQESYDQLVDAGVQPCYVRSDEFFFPSDQLDLARKVVYDGDPETVAAFGKLKVGHEGVTYDPVGLNPGLGCFSNHDFATPYLEPKMTDFVTIDEEVVKMERAQVKTTVKPLPDEYELANIYDYRRLLIKANVPGAGKSHAVLSRFAKETVVVCPTNALCVAFRSKYPGVTALTLHKFLRVNVDLEGAPERDTMSEEEREAGVDPVQSVVRFRENQAEFNKVLLLDEIFMYPLALLGKLYFRLSTTSAKRVFATGDSNQLPPVREGTGDSLSDISVEKARRMAAVDLLFPVQMELRECKRGNSQQDNKRMSALCLQMRNPGFTMPMVRDLVKRNFTPMTQGDAITAMRADPEKYISVCYYNMTCSRIAKSVLAGGNKCALDVRLVNRRRCMPTMEGKPGSRSVLMVNYEYTVSEVQERTVTLECVMTKNRFTVTKLHVNQHMHWAQTRTCHSLQGSSVDGSIVLWDLESRLITPEFIYVAMTRARSLDEVYYVV